MNGNERIISIDLTHLVRAALAGTAATDAGTAATGAGAPAASAPEAPDHAGVAPAAG